ncbi:HPP family protein [Uniformispora flossi]|uniref:CBS domain-containing protein n=1 Tax=Uniformispora flossi TaxID=3390723 RepID=UPI003C2D8556
MVPIAPPASHTAADVLQPCGPSIGEHTTVDEANDLFAARPDIPHLIVVDEDGRCEGVLTRASLAAFLARNWYSERTPVRDTHHQRGPFAWPDLPLALAAASMRAKHHTVWPVTDDQGRVLGVLTPGAVADAMHARRQPVSP